MRGWEMTCNLYSSIEAAKEAMEKLSTETKEYFERQTELINKAFTGDEQTTKTKPEIKKELIELSRPQGLGLQLLTEQELEVMIAGINNGLDAIENEYLYFDDEEDD